MKMLVLSDLHLEHLALDIVPPADTDVVVLAGDIDAGSAGVAWAAESFAGIPVVYVPGNHEFYGCEIGEALAAMREAASGTNVHLLERDFVVFSGIRFIGATLWTDFRLYCPGNDPEEQMWAMVDAGRCVPDFDGRIRERSGGHELPFSPRLAQRRHDDAVRWIGEELRRPFDGRTVVVTHHAPSEHSVAPFFSGHAATPAFASNVEALVRQCDLWIHGHTHDSCRYPLNGATVICNPRGYGSENARFDPGLLVTL